MTRSFTALAVSATLACGALTAAPDALASSQVAGYSISAPTPAPQTDQDTVDSYGKA